MSMFDILLPVAKVRGQVRLVDGRVATLVRVRKSRARIWFAPDPLDPRAKGDGHGRTIDINEILEVVTASSCTCTRCGSSDGVDLHADCCAGSGIEVYDHACPVPRHAALADRQFGPLTEETPE